MVKSILFLYNISGDSMKKFWVFLILLFVPLMVINAQGIEDYYFDITVENNGDLLVEEYFNLTGSYNGFERDILYANNSAYDFNANLESYGPCKLHNGSSIEILEVKGVPISSKFNFDSNSGDSFKKVSSAKKGNYGKYTESNISYGKRITIYNPSRKKKAFYLKYRISNMAIVYNDVAEFGYNFIGNSIDESIHNIKLTVHVPGNSSILKAWGHTSTLTGDIKVVDQETVEATLENINAYHAVDIRLVFDRSVVSNSNKIILTDALDKIILYEEDTDSHNKYEQDQIDQMNINGAKSYIEAFRERPYRSNYDMAKSYINKIHDKSIKKELLEELESLVGPMKEYEQKKAISSVNYCKKHCTSFFFRHSYENARNDVKVLDEGVLKEQLSLDLDACYKKIYHSEFIFLLVTVGCSLGLGFIITISFIILTCIVVKKKHANNTYDYYRDIPSKQIPGVVDLLMNKEITNNSVSAHVLRLINEGKLSYNKIDSDDYILVKNKDVYEGLDDIDKSLIDLIMCNQGAISLKDIKKYEKKNYIEFSNKYNKYANKVGNDARKKDYFVIDNDNNISNGLMYILLGMSLSFSLVGIPLMIYGVVCIIKGIKKSKLSHSALYGLLLILFVIDILLSIIFMIVDLIALHDFTAIVLIVYLLKIFAMVGVLIYAYVRVNNYTRFHYTDLGVEELEKWKGLKHFLKDFGTFDDAELPEVALWDEYLVYATLFGCADEVSKVMDLKISDRGLKDVSFDHYTSLVLVNHVIHSNISSSINHSVSYSNVSSSGGGFSHSSGHFSGGGGGSFGGGGGGHRF